MNGNNKLENSLIIRENENIFTRMLKWIKGIFVKKDKDIVTNVETEQEITIPKAVKMPVRIEEVDENSLEYLYKLSDDDLDKLSDKYDAQMEDARTEIEKLDNILQSYRQSIKKLQGEMSEEM